MLILISPLSCQSQRWHLEPASPLRDRGQLNKSRVFYRHSKRAPRSTSCLQQLICTQGRERRLPKQDGAALDPV